MAKKCEDLTGMKFGRLTVISYNKEVSKQKKKTCWNCKCECGNEKIVRDAHLKNGSTNSCGCYQREQIKEKWKDEEFRQAKSDKMKKMVKEKWQDEEYKQMQSNRMKEQNEKMWQDEEFKQMQSNKMKELWNNEEFRQIQSNKMKEIWNDEDMRWKMNYKGGITPISTYLRDEQWFYNCKQQANYTCELTGKVGGKLHTHHLKAFSTIVLEAHELHNIQIKPQVKDYTEEELHKLEEYVASWHKDNSNAVVLSEEVHKLFHKLYGKGDNTPEQFEEFRERYIAGEFKDLI